MTVGLVEAEPVLSTIDNSLSHQRLLRMVLQEGDVPTATYDFKGSQHNLTDGLLHVIISFFLPLDRKIQRQSAVVGEALALNIHVWVLPVHITNKPSIVKREGGPGIYEVHIIAPLREDLTGIIW